MAKKSRFVVIEGIDQSGKQTQSKLLRKRFKQEGYNARILSFPNYKTRIGLLIKSFLSNKISYPAEVRHMLLSANRWETKTEIEEYLNKGFTLICNRYYHSNLPYGIANGLKRSWLESLDRGLPKPDAVVLIDVSPEVSLARKGMKRDLHEKDLDFLAEVKNQYLELAKEGDWIVVDGEKSVVEVSKNLWTALSKKLKISQT